MKILFAIVAINLMPVLLLANGETPNTSPWTYTAPAAVLCGLAGAAASAKTARSSKTIMVTAAHTALLGVGLTLATWRWSQNNPALAWVFVGGSVLLSLQGMNAVLRVSNFVGDLLEAWIDGRRRANDKDRKSDP